MMIYLEELAERLRNRVSVRAYNLKSRAVAGIRMFPPRYGPGSPDLSLDPDVLYVCEYRKLRFYDPHAEMPPLLCVLEPGAAPDDACFTGRAALAVSGVTVPDLLALLADLAYSIGGETSSLAESSRRLLSCRDTGELLSAGAELLGSPIIVTDEAQRVAAWEDSGAGDAAFQKMVELAYLPVGHPEMESGDPFGGRDYPFVSEGREENGLVLPSVMVKRMRVGGRIVGYLHVFRAGRDFSPEDAETAELLGNLLAVELRKEPGPRNKDDRQWEIEHFFTDILENDYDGAEIIHRQRNIGLELGRYIYAVSVHARKNRINPGPSLHDLAGEMASQVPGCYGFLFHNSVFLVFSREEEVPGEGFFEPLLPLLRENDMMAGVSNPFSSTEFLREYASQSRKAIQLGMVLHKEKTLYFYKDYSIYHMIELCLRNEHVSTFCLPEVLRLAEHERGGRTDLLDTLWVYLNNGRSKTETARVLGVHLNTVKYRLQQIWEIMGLDLDQDDNAMKVMLSFKMLEYQEKFWNGGPQEI